jgi:hypothetical protein
MKDHARGGRRAICEGWVKIPEGARRCQRKGAHISQGFSDPDNVAREMQGCADGKRMSD